MQLHKVSWMHQANIYEVNIRQYTREGTFAAFATHLPRLKDMGVEIIWLMPITPISVEGRLGALGSYYACSSYTDINPEYGTLDDFRQLVEAVHALEMKLIIDWVANHTGIDHHWTKEHPDYYVQDAAGNFTERNGWKDVIDLNYNNAALRMALIEAMQFWVREFKIDGFRCDMAHLVPLDFWITARNSCESLQPLFWLAECEDETYHEVYDVSYAWEWMHVSEKLAKQIASVQQLKDVVTKYQHYPFEGKKLYFTSNHDENSWNGTEYEKYSRFAKAYAILSCTLPGLPLIYSGQELPNNRRLKFFDKDEIIWHEQPELHNFYQVLLGLRKKSAAYTKEAFFDFLYTSEDQHIMAYLLHAGEDKVLVVANLSVNDKVHVKVQHGVLQGKYKSVFSGLDYVLENEAAFELQSAEYLVLSTVN